MPGTADSWPQEPPERQQWLAPGAVPIAGHYDAEQRRKVLEARIDWTEARIWALEGVSPDGFRQDTSMFNAALALLTLLNRVEIPPG